MNTRIMMLMGVVTLLSGATAARDVYLSSSRYGNATQNLDTPSQWCDESGNTVSSALGDDVDMFIPTTAQVAKPEAPATKYATVYNFVVVTRNTFTSAALNSLSGGVGSYLCYAANTQNSGLGDGKKERTLTIASPNDFDGHFRSGYDTGATLFGVGGGQAMKIALTGDEVAPQLPHVAATTLTTVDVPANTHASVATVYGGGKLVKSGAGSLSVQRTDGSALQFEVEAGELTLQGAPQGQDVAAILADAVLHLDATKVDASGTYAGADGRTYVRVWPSVKQGGISATSIVAEYTPSSGKVPCVNDPFVSDKVSPSGLALVDFGSASNASSVPYDAALGPSNCVLALSADVSGAREVFVAYQRSHAAAQFTPYLGTSGSAHTECLPSGDTLFSGECADSIKNGDVRFNGVPVHYAQKKQLVDAYSNGTADFHIVSIAPTEALTRPFDLIGSDRYNAGRTGGIRVGEILVFTRALSEDERNAVNRYLRAKWFGSSDCEAGSALVANGASLSVPANRTAYLPFVRLTSGTTLVKNGDGELVIGQLSPADATVQVNGGSVSIRASEAVPDTAPAARPFLWLDATAGESIVTEGGGVTRWNDRRAATATVGDASGFSGGYAEIPEGNAIWTNAGGEKPTVVADAAPVAGRNVVDYGNSGWLRVQPNYSGDSNAAISNYAYDNAKTGFIVVRFKESKTTQFGTPFGSSVHDAYRGTARTMLSSATTTNPRAQAATFTKDGLVYGTTEACGDDDCQFHVYSISAGVKLRLDQIVKDRWTGEHGAGNAQVGEFILYDRQLSIAERHATEKYLMKKWLGSASHPAETAPEPTFVYDADATVVVDSDTDGAVSASGGSGVVVKRGAGHVALNMNALADVRSVTVEAGSLTHSVASLLSEALFRFDATATASFETEVTEVGGAVVTNVTAWADVQGNGLEATLATNRFLKHVPAYPTLQMAQMPDGKRRPTVDFGPLWKDSLGWRPERSAALDFSAKVETVREAFIVYSDQNEDVNRRRQFFFGAQNLSWCYRSLSPSGALLDNRWCDSSLHTPVSRIWLDGTLAATNTLLDAEGAEPSFHVINVSPTANVTISGMAAFNDDVGGCRISEELAFSRNLTDAERTRVTNYLRRKWLGADVQTGLSLDNLSIARSAAFAVPADETLAADAVVLAGEVTSDALLIGTSLQVGDGVAPAMAKVTGDLSFAADSTMTIPCPLSSEPSLVVTGSVDGAPTVSIRFNGARPTPGDYVLMSAGDLSDLDFAAMTFGTDLSPDRQRLLRLRVIGNTLVLSVQRPGFCISFH